MGAFLLASVQSLPPTSRFGASEVKCRRQVFEVRNMTHALIAAVAEAEKLPAEEQDVLAAILVEEIASEQRWSQSFARSEHVMEALAAEALAEFKSGKTKPLDELL
jgi:hypothetical protein